MQDPKPNPRKSQNTKSPKLYTQPENTRVDGRIPHRAAKRGVRVSRVEFGVYLNPRGNDKGVSKNMGP